MMLIDGSFGEGGGQILRNAAAYAAILQKDLRIEKIRAGRSNPGLRRQHITGLQLLANGCGGNVTGASVGSKEILFRAGQRPPSNQGSSRLLTGDTKTAGSVCLLLQATLPLALLFGPYSTKMILKGGTNASNAPQYDYWEQLFLPVLREQCNIPHEYIQASVVRRGFFPKGGGEVQVEVKALSGSIPPISLTDRGTVDSIHIRAFFAGNCPKRVAEDMAMAAKDHISSNLDQPSVSVEVVHEKDAVASGSGILIVATTTTGCRFGGSALGHPKMSPHKSGTEAAQELCQTLADGGCVDEYLQDQLIIYMALAQGESEMITGSLTLHTQTAIWTAEQCCQVKFHVKPLDGGGGGDRPGSPPEEKGGLARYGRQGRRQGRHRIRCTGIGFSHS